MKKYLLLTILCACQSLPSLKPAAQTQKFFLDNTASRHLELNPGLGPRLFHSTAPLITEDKVITGNAIDGIRVFDKSGKELWSKAIEGGIESGFVAKGNRLYYGANDYRFYSLNLESGLEVWKFETEGEILSAPLLVGENIYFTTGNNILYSLNAKDGSLNWRYKRNLRENFTVRGSSTPVMYKQKIVVGFSDGYFAAINSSDGSLSWERNLGTNPKFKDVDAEAVVEGDNIYISAYDSALYCLSGKEGRILWSVDQGGVYPVAIHGDKIYYSTSNKKLLVLDKSSGKILGEQKAKGIFQAPVIRDNLLFLADTAGPLQIFDTHTNKELSSFHPGHGITSPLIVEEQRVYFLSRGANLFEMTYGWRKPQ